MSEPARKPKTYQTEWIGQFGVACELARRDYLVSMPLGNAPIRDIICVSPGQKTFSVQVKSFRRKGYISIGSLPGEVIKDLWFVFVHVPKNLDLSLEYHIISHEDLLRARMREKEEVRSREERRGKPYKP